MSVIKKVLKLIVCVSAIVLLNVAKSHAQTIRYQQSIRGGFAIAANALDLTAGGFLGCGSSWANTAAGATCSSYSDLVLPAGSSIVNAFLYVETYSGGTPITGVKFKVQGGAYITLTTASAGYKGNPNTSGYGQFIIDVTSLMPSNGYVSTVTAGGSASTTGRYSVADPITSGISTGEGWGWCLFVVYANPASPLRNITIADACNTSSSNLVINNIVVPASGIVKASVAVTGSWGDVGLTDYASFGPNGGTLYGLIDPTTNASNDVLNSTIGFAPSNNVTSDGGPVINGNFTARNPYIYTQPSSCSGAWYSCFYDADIFDIPAGTLSPSPIPISVNLKQASGGGDAIGFGAYAVSIDIAAANITKVLSPTTISNGGVATYTWTIDNTITGAINQTLLGFTDNLPINIIVANPAGAVLTGGAGGTLTATPGANAVTLSGLSLNAGQTATMTVNVTNVAGQFNASCATNPLAFTNGFSNITGNPLGLANAITNQCLIVSTTPLPIELINFSGNFNKGIVNLSWETASEINNKVFYVERYAGTDNNYQRIGSVNGANSSNVQLSYQFKDEEAPVGVNYYRLSQEDFDGKITTSKQVVVQVGKQAIKNIAARIQHDGKLTLTFNADGAGVVKMQVFDLLGAKLVEVERAIDGGMQELQVDVSQLPKGAYFVTLQQGGEIGVSTRIVKVD